MHTSTKKWCNCSVQNYKTFPIAEANSLINFFLKQQPNLNLKLELFSLSMCANNLIVRTHNGILVDSLRTSCIHKICIPLFFCFTTKRDV